MIKKDISNRADVELLVNTFYDRIRQNEKIGFYFNETISDWDSHLEKLTDFWDTQLLNARNFKGNPRTAHIKVDNRFNHEITTKEFGEWLNLWFKTVNELFKGEVAQTVKTELENVNTSFYEHVQV